MWWRSRGRSVPSIAEPTQPAPAPKSPEAPEVYGALFKEQYDSEIARKASLEARGITVVTSSGVLVTLLFGLAAVVTKPETWRPSVVMLSLLVLALALFCAAAIGGLRANRLVTTHVLSPGVLDELRTKRWSDSGEDARSVVAYWRIQATDELRELNDKKAKSLAVGLFSQLGALISLVLAVCYALIAAALG